LPGERRMPGGLLKQTDESRGLPLVTIHGQRRGLPR
jgi:hypothetical protein